MKPRCGRPAGPFRALLAAVVVATTPMNPASLAQHAPRLQCARLTIAGSSNHSSAGAAPGPAQLSVTALDVAPSTGSVFAVARDLDNAAADGEVLVYKRGDSQVRPLELHRDVGALRDGFAPTELSLMEVGNAVLLAIVVNAAPRAGDAVEVLRVEDALSQAGPAGLTLLRTVILPGVAAHITGLWAVWPRGVYVTSCNGAPDSASGCTMQYCQGAEPDWRAVEAAAGAWRRVEYSCAVVLETDSGELGSENTVAMQAVVGSPMLKAIYTVRTRAARQDSARGSLTSLTAVDDRTSTVPELIGLSRDGRAPTSTGTPQVTAWHVASIAGDEEAHVLAAGKPQPDKPWLVLHHKLWVEIATGELLALQSSVSHCVIYSAPAAPERPPNHLDGLELRKVAHAAERCTAVVRLPPGGSDVSAPPLAIGIARNRLGEVLAICEESQTDADHETTASEAAQRRREEL